ncbi:MAG: Lrp/AsnC family transcriptional regulator [Candidatus Zixiibacteriota bacterium]|nr:MAG: Lrp/AsnC family transcriptional regulator [candidate division Zixibacteria bacterium]
MRTIDAIDEQILKIIQTDARIPNVDIARKIGFAPSAISERLRKLVRKGIIERFEARLNADALGLGLLAFVFVRTSETAGASVAAPKLAEIPEVQEVFNVAGEDCYLVKVRARNTDALGKLLRDRIGSIETVQSTRTTIVLETFKETTSLPVSPTEASTS